MPEKSGDNISDGCCGIGSRGGGKGTDDDAGAGVEDNDDDVLATRDRRFVPGYLDDRNSDGSGGTGNRGGGKGALSSTKLK